MPSGERCLDGSDEGTAWGRFGTTLLPDELLTYGLVWLRDAQDRNRKLQIR